jgi:hypothetical protein
MSPLVLFCLMVLSCALLLTAHVAIVVGLLACTPRYRALIAVVLPPLGAVWAIRGKQRLRGMVWFVAASVYVTVRLLG